MSDHASGQHTFAEIDSQSLAWSEALRQYRRQEDDVRRAWSAHRPATVLFTGCGSTYYLAQSAAALFEAATGRPADALPGSEIALPGGRGASAPETTLMVAISRSGTTSETVAAARAFRQMGGPALWCITCAPASPLAEAADLVLAAEAAQEQSMAQTRSFSAMLVLAQALAATVAGPGAGLLATLPDFGREVGRRAGSFMLEWGRRLDLERFYFLGSGLRYGLANEAMMKMTEMSLSHAQSFHFLEFRHGPMAMADDRCLVVGLLSREAADHEMKVLDEMAGLGAATLALSPFAGGEPAAGARDFAVGAPLPNWAIAALYLPPLQWLAYHRAMAKGLNPDAPRHLRPAIHLAGL
jgi:glucosamine--fructose-6-phosphate aminotransferase (isomerizing)